MSTYTVEAVKFPALVGQRSLIGAGSQRPVGWGNYFWLSNGFRVVNMWAENLEHLVSIGVLEDGLISGLAYTTVNGAKFFLVTDERIPIDYVYNKLCFAGSTRPSIDVVTVMYDIVGDPHGELEQYIDPVSYYKKQGATYDSKTGIIKWGKMC